MKKIIRNLRTWLIHKLGGVTIDELMESNKYNFKRGLTVAHKSIKQYADSIYGLPAEEWCKNVYYRIKYYSDIYNS